MNLQLQGKTALVTGSTAGIGLAIASALAKERAVVIVNGRSQARVDEAVRASGAAHGIAADLGTEAGADAVIEHFPKVDILVNNVGIFEPKPFEAITDAEWLRFRAGCVRCESPVGCDQRSGLACRRRRGPLDCLRFCQLRREPPTSVTEPRP